MTATTTPKTLDQMNIDETAHALGIREYQYRVMKAEMDEIAKHMYKLNKEAFDAQQKVDNQNKAPLDEAAPETDTAH